MPEFLTFSKFQSNEDARELTSLLENSKIEFTVELERNPLDQIYTGASLDPLVAVKIPQDRKLAERQMLGILLREPQKWHKVGLIVHPEDFADVDRRRLADVYWQHQQDLGEPEFREFIGQLDEPVIKALALELMAEAEEMEDVEQTLEGALSFIREERRRREDSKHLAELRRISHSAAGSQDVEAKWAEFVKNNQTSDLRRLGPVRRFKSGS